MALIAPATASAAGAGLNAYDVKTDAKGIRELARQGFDMTEGRHGDHVEIAATEEQVSTLRKLGLQPTLKRDGQGRSALRADAQAQRSDGSYDVYRPYFDPTYAGTENGEPVSASNPRRQTLYEEMVALADEHRDIVKREIIGYSINNKPILALKFTKDARTVQDGSRPAALYSSTQHAREWITPEMNRRLAHLFADNFTTVEDDSPAVDEDGDPLGENRAGDDPSAAAGVTKGEITRLLTEHEMWIVIVANPDGYDFTFTPDNRLWRKNLREINGQPGTQTGDGVDPNRNYATNWGYDNEGSSPDPASETYRGSGPNSEPETQALDGLLKRVGFEFQVNYHSAAELLLYPLGVQVETLTADNPIYVALSGTDDDSAIKGASPGAPNYYDPDVGAELYTTNGETTDHAHGVYGTLAWTPEMDVAVDSRGGGPSDFVFQDDDGDLEQAFEKNIPFALDVGTSADDPANPESHLGNTTPDFEIEPFDFSHGDPQQVQVNAKRELGPVQIHWQVNGGDERSAGTQEWKGGERYGHNYDDYYHRVRGTVRDTNPGDRVRVWFEAGGERSQAFTYEAVSETRNPVLIMAAEDYSGNTNQPEYGPGSGPRFVSYYENALKAAGVGYENALKAAGVGYDVYDVDGRNRTSPDELGVLSHYKAVVWYTGNDLITREPDQPGQSGASRLNDDEILAVRAFLNEGGKLLYTGQNAALGQVDAYAFNPGQPPYCTSGSPVASQCVPLSNDFLQYWLGAYIHINAAADKDQASGLAFTGAGGPFGSTPFTLNGGDSADNQEHTYSMVTTSSILPRDQFPLFESDVAVAFQRPSSFDPVTGDRYAVAESNDEGYQRLRRTIDLTGVSAADLQFKFSYDTEPAYDYVFVEAHTVGQDDWTTLPDENDHTSTDVGDSCAIDWQSLHPFLAHYQTEGNDPTTPETESCYPRGNIGSPPGEWNAASGNSGGYQDWKLDLSRYAGRQVEVSITYAQDFAVPGLGAFVDDVKITKDGAVTEETSFEDGLGGFTAGPAPEGSENDAQWASRTSVGFAEGPGIATEDTLYYGFGLEGITSADQRAALMTDAMRYLGVLNPGGQTPGPGPGPGPGGPGAGGGQGGNPAQPVAGGGVQGQQQSRRSLGLRKRTLRVGKSRRFKVALRCPPSAGNQCRGLLRVVRGRKNVAARRSFRVTARKYRTVRLRMAKRDFRRLVRSGRMRVKVVLVTRDDAGTLRRKTVRMTAKPTKAARRAARD